MIKIEEKVDNLYVIKLAKSVYGKTRYSHIQFSPWTGDPIINTDFGYRAGLVVAFKSMDQAKMFYISFFGKRGRFNEGWQIYPYKPAYSKQMEYSFREVDTKYGRCLTLSNVRNPRMWR